jgi:hypothetical protein
MALSKRSIRMLNEYDKISESIDGFPNGIDIMRKYFIKALDRADIAEAVRFASSNKQKVSIMQRLSYKSEPLLCGRESDCKNYGERCGSCSRLYRDLYWTW